VDGPEHNCDPAGEHCLGCCERPLDCVIAMHRPPVGAVVFRPMGIWCSWDVALGPHNEVKRMDVYGEGYGDRRAEQRIGGPSR
jgi:hypothetical protein